MSKKRKRETEGEDSSGVADVPGASENDAIHEDDEEFAGFTDDEGDGSNFDFEDDRNDKELEEGEEEGGIPVRASDSASETDQKLSKHHKRSQR